jgi:cytosine permease
MKIQEELSMSKNVQDYDFSLQAVPQGSKKGFWSMLVVMLGFTFFSASMAAGGTLGTSLTIKDFLIAIVSGNLILGVYTSLLAYIGSSTSLSTHILARYSFGEKGSYLVSFILSITQIGWFGVGVAMFALPVQKVTGMNLYLLIAIAGICMTSSAYFGMKTLTILSFIAVPSIAVLGGFSVFRAVDSIGGLAALFAVKPQNSMALSAALSLCVGSFISGGTLTPDFIRFSKNKKVGVSTTLIAFFIGNALMFIFGAVGASVTGLSDISEVMFTQGLIIPAIIVLGFNIWTTNDNAIYASGLGFSNITGIPKNKLVLFNGIIGTIGALFLYNNFIGWLSFLNSIIPPIGAVLIADYFFVNREKYKNFEGMKFESVNVNAIASWFVGVLAAKFIPGIAPINGVAAAAIVYVAMAKLLSTSAAVTKQEQVGNNYAD